MTCSYIFRFRGSKIYMCPSSGHELIEEKPGSGELVSYCSHHKLVRLAEISGGVTNPKTPKPKLEEAFDDQLL